MKKSLILLSAVFAAGAAHADEMSDAQTFVKKASMSNLLEIESSKLALEKAQDPEVKAFAQQMIDDHTKAGNALKAAISESGLNGLQPQTSLSEKEQEKMADLREESGEEFDEEYVELQEDAHDRAVELFEDYAEDGENAALQKFASSTLPTLKQHEDHADELDDEGFWD